jgi:hypothetical protein
MTVMSEKTMTSHATVAAKKARRMRALVFTKKSFNPFRFIRKASAKIGKF